MKDIGKNIEKHRKRLRLTRKELAEKADINIKTLEFIERGKTVNPSLDKIVAIAETLDVPLNELVYGKNEKTTSFSEDELKTLKASEDALQKFRDALDIILKKI
jgi:transcriptional regulator with XRE-family HTH domain